MKKTMKTTINFNTLNITEKQKKILEKLYAKKNGAFFNISFETYYGYKEPNMNAGVSAAWKGHVVSKTTVTSVRKGIDYNNVKAVKEKRAREGYIPTVKKSNKHYLDKTLLKNNDEEKYFVALFPNKGKPQTTYKLDGRPITKEKLIELGVMQPSFWKSKSQQPMFTVGLDKIIDVH